MLRQQADLNNRIWQAVRSNYLNSAIHIRWILDLPLSRRNMIFDHNPFHFRIRTPLNNRLGADGRTNVLYVDGHVKTMDYQKFLAYLWGDREPC